MSTLTWPLEKLAPWQALKVLWLLKKATSFGKKRMALISLQPQLRSRAVKGSLTFLPLKIWLPNLRVTLLKRDLRLVVNSRCHLTELRTSSIPKEEAKVEAMIKPRVCKLWTTAKKMTSKTSKTTRNHTMFYQARRSSSSTKSIRNRVKSEEDSSLINQVMLIWAPEFLLLSKLEANGLPKWAMVM